MAVDGQRVTVTVRNTGSRAGREVVQCYAAPTTPDPARPRRWLVGFAVVTAKPGESATVTIDMPQRAFQIWVDGAWRTANGTYDITAGHSIADPRLVVTTTIG